MNYFYKYLNKMHNIFLSLALLLTSISLNAQKIKLPQTSPHQEVIQNFGLGTIALSYSRPSLRGRSIGEDFVPYGEVWRTGANGATTLEFSEDVTIGGKLIMAGKYGLLSIPNEKEWIVIITTDINVNNPSKYNEANDVVRVSIPVQKRIEKMETFTINFDTFTSTSCIMQLTWEHSLIEVELFTDIDKTVMSQIEAAFDQKNLPYYAAAQYYYDTNRDLQQAKQWVDKATDESLGEERLHIWLLKAQIYQKLGDKKGTKVTAAKIIQLSEKLKNDEYKQKATSILNTL